MIVIGKLYSKEQVERAKDISLVEYLMRRGEILKHAGSEYKYIYRDSSGEHDSVMVRDNKWYDFKNQQGGDTIGFLQEFMGFSFREAVEELLNGEQGECVSKLNHENSNVILPQKEKDFILPEASNDIHRLFAYLSKTRLIDVAVIQHFVKSKSMYQEKEHGNIVFLGLDKQGIPQSAQKVSTNTYKPKFKCSISGSNTRYGFHHKGKSQQLFVFESPIDLMSYITIYPENWQENNYIALDGLSPKAMFLFLEENKEIDSVNLCIDYDEAGIEAYNKFKDTLIEKSYKPENIQRLYPTYKDWNEMLKAEAGHKPIQAKEHPKVKQYCNIISFLNDMCEKTQNTYVKLRYKQYMESGTKFVSKELGKLYAGFQNEIQRDEIVKLKSNDNNKPKLQMLRMADFCITIISFMELEKNNIENQKYSYKTNLNELLNNYKPYKDKGKFRVKLDEVNQSYQTIKDRLKTIDDKIVKDALKDCADICIKMAIYIDLNYTIDLSVALNLKNRNEQIFENQHNNSYNISMV